MKGGGIDAAYKGPTGNIILHLVASGGDVSVMKTLLENKEISVHVDQRNRYGQSPIYVAASKGHLEVIKMLCEYGATPNLETADDTIPLHKAAEGGYLEVVKYLVEESHSDDIHKKNKKGQTPLDLARANEHLEVVKYLEEKAPVPKA
ncbi:Ankyrin repeats containing protein [Cardinium endosymbiont of Sogatella furcifera]|uniref:ankyrin repeat domain-containing protein n=1 Tax=Cardinium endosymbiont of Sogatella furcifera TaxID=650378 RepID=UPI000E0D1797|nr:ankyrin repeat domain-containing protein [Cardinium endosymbiont of Sogatella furcifera]AXI24110.1 Ankyrin repeats containing protein [Cardinium endosymbiont of Sogatella furcifera]